MGYDFAHGLYSHRRSRVTFCDDNAGLRPTGMPKVERQAQVIRSRRTLELPERSTAPADMTNNGQSVAAPGRMASAGDISLCPNHWEVARGAGPAAPV